VATRKSSANDFCASSCVRNSTARALSSNSGGTHSIAPSPSKTKGISVSPAAFSMPVMTAAPSVLTFLYRPDSTAAVELRTSHITTCQLSGSGV